MTKKRQQNNQNKCAYKIDSSDSTEIKPEQANN